MSLDISAFRSIAAQSPDKLVYVSGQKLKSTNTQGSRGPEVFKAAVDAFIKAYGDHYGAKLGNMSRKSLQEYADGSKPLTASVVKQMLDYADSKVGSARTVTVGDTTIDISKVGTEKIPFQGFTSKTKSARAWDGQGKAIKDALATLACKDGGKIDPKALLKALNTAHEYTRLELSTHGTATPAAMGDRKNHVFAAAARALDNRTLSSVYQGIASRETEELKDELSRLMSHPDVSVETQRLAEQAFTDICRLESYILLEVSSRIKAGDKNPLAAGDVTSTNLGLLVGTTAKGAIAAKESAKTVESTLASHGMDSVEARQIGDTIRNNELTINMHLKYLLGWEGLDKGKDKPTFLQPGGQVLNAYQIQEMSGEDTLGTGYMKTRDEVETQLFPEYAGPGKPVGKERPVYAAMNTMAFTSGGAGVAGNAYGKTVIVLKDHVKKQCTFTLDDTFFLERFSMKQQDRPRIEKMIVDGLADKFADKDAVLAAMRGDDKIKTALNKLFSAVDAAGTTHYQAVHEASVSIAAALKAHLKPDAALDEFDIEALFFKNCADFGSAKGKVASFDNIENLFAQQTDFNVVKLATATLMKRDDPSTPIKLRGTQYIEAQIHQPVSFDTDVAEIRIDQDDIYAHFYDEFKKLGDGERAAIENDATLGDDAEKRRDAWIAQRMAGEIVRIQEMTKDAPFVVSFYSSSKRGGEDTNVYLAADKAQDKTVYQHLREDLVATAKSLKKPEGIKSVLRDVIGTLNPEAPGNRKLFEVYGNDLSGLPKWALDNVVKASVDKTMSVAETKKTLPGGEETIRSNARTALSSTLSELAANLVIIADSGVTDPKEMKDCAQQMVLSKVQYKNAAAFQDVRLTAKRALADINGFATSAVSKHVPGGEQLLKDAFNGLPPVGQPPTSVLYGKTAKIIEDEASAIRKEIAALGTDGKSLAKARQLAEGASERIAKKVAEFVGGRASLLAVQKGFHYANEAERNAFIGWASSAGKIKTGLEIQGVYEMSGLIADALEAKLKNGGTLTPKDLVDAFNAVKDTCKKYIAQDKANHFEYGPDDKNIWVTRAASVAISRLAARIGLENAKKLAESLNTPAVRYLTLATRTAVTREDLGYLSVFLDTLYQRSPQTLGVKVPYLFLPRNMTYASVSQGTRDLFATVNAGEAQSLAAEFPYQPGAAGVSSFKKIAAPANPAGMPQTLEHRKNFLKAMLPIYHKNELPGGFDHAHNTHGRAHATRAFIFSVVMGNILKEKGVAIDDNAACLAAAGHDSGRFKKGKDTPEQEAASAANTAQALRKQFHDAPGEEWIDATKKNICAPDDDNTQRTIEGYIFKSADSIEISRLGDVDMKKFPFLREPLLTEDGLVILPDEELRKALVKEAEALARMTSPNTQKVRESIELTIRFAQLPDGPERNALKAESEKAKKDGRDLEAQQAATMSDDELVAMIEKTIRDNPATFPLLNKYYH